MARRSKAQRERRELEATAFHEAGHAVVAVSLGRAIRYVTVVPSDDYVGCVAKTRPPESIRPDLQQDARTLAWINREVKIGLAGVVAEGLLRGRHNHIGASQDYKHVVDLASYVYGYGEVLTKWIDFMLALTRNYVRHPLQWVRIEAVAAALLVEKRLGAKRVREICAVALGNRERLKQLFDEAIEREEERNRREMELYERQQARKRQPA
jgi:hypothetical protein